MSEPGEFSRVEVGTLSASSTPGGASTDTSKTGTAFDCRRVDHLTLL